MTSTINASTSSGIVQTADTSGVLALQTGGTTALTIDTSQNVGIGTSSPAYKLDVAGIVNSNQAIKISKDGSDSVASGPYYQMANAAGTRTWLTQLGGSNQYDWWYYDGSVWNQRMRIDSSGNLLFNSGYGSAATAYGCRAWVNFNGTGTVAIRASGNVSSITDNAVGYYTVNLTTAMPDTNYSTVANCMNQGVTHGVAVPGGQAYSTTAVSIDTFGLGAITTKADMNLVLVAVFR